MTTAEINTYQDLLDLLDEKPQWLQDLRVRLLTPELIALPEQLARFAEESNRRQAATESDVRELKEGQTRMEADMRELKDGQARLEDGQARTEADVRELKEGQARTEADVQELKEGQARTEADVRELKNSQARTEADVQELKNSQARMQESQARTEADVRELKNSQARTEADVQELKNSQARTEADVQELKNSQARMQESQARTEADVRELKEGQARTEADVRELKEGQARMQESQVRMENRITRMETRQNRMDGTINNLRGDKYERRITRFIALTARRDLNMRNVRVLLGEFTPDNNELADLLTDAEGDRNVITEEQGRDLERSDIIIAGFDRGDGRPVYAVIEVALTLDRDDIFRAERRAGALAAATGQKALPVAIGNAVDDIDRQRADDAGVAVLIIYE